MTNTKVKAIQHCQQLFVPYRHTIPVYNTIYDVHYTIYAYSIFIKLWKKVRISRCKALVNIFPNLQDVLHMHLPGLPKELAASLMMMFLVEY